MHKNKGNSVQQTQSGAYQNPCCKIILKNPYNVNSMTRGINKAEDQWKRLEKITSHRTNSSTYFSTKLPKNSLEKD